ncbi:hypothetical protein [Vitiosangium sp. GDMCC 1.1324]|uniref:hypothetical protein n=1 Tax=Vitiosangium sp. (strain GDMCC 1.1324) TaxID=2138576 RepID=UPI00130DEB6F|nr:hypothetical protein [Vitiosangium sp. GDMCC 1.1324]
MKVVFINHHLFQDGDTYGLIYALVLNQALKVEALRLGLFWINDDLYQPGVNGASQEVRDYTRKVQTRLGYFESFGQFGPQVVLARCRFSDAVDVVEYEAGDNELLITANKTLFKDNPRLVSLFLTGEENDPSLWLKELDARLDARVKVDAGSLAYAANALEVSLAELPSPKDLERLRNYLKVHSSYSSDSLCYLVRGLGPSTRTAFKALVARTFGFERDDELYFAYISKSTDYVRQCITVKGFAAVADALRKAVLRCTQAYTEDNRTFIRTFMAGLIAHKDPVARLGVPSKPPVVQLGVPSKKAPEPILLLFWIRGAKKDEESAILGTYEQDGSGKAPSVGKPQHHTNVTLYKQVRHMVKELSVQTGVPILFVPIGDELVEDFGTTVTDASRSVALSRTALEHAALVLGISLTQRPSHEEYTRLCMYLRAHYGYDASQVEMLLELRSGFKKGAKDHNLIRFFEREPFRNRPMGAQINFLLQLASQYRVVQVGMRSGSMERLMYLGVPTIYFDRTKPLPDLPNPVGAARIKQLCLFEGDSLTELMDYFMRCDAALNSPNPIKGYPLFFQIENRDTGFLKYSSVSENRVNKMIEKLAEHHLRDYNQLKHKIVQKGFLSSPGFNELRRNLLKLGGLVDAEEQKMLFMLWFTMFVYPRYSALLNADAPRVGGAPQRSSSFQTRLNFHRTLRELEIHTKRKERSDRKKGGGSSGTSTSTATASPPSSSASSSSSSSSGMGGRGGGAAVPLPVAVGYQVNDLIRVDYMVAYDVVGRITGINGNLVTMRIDHCYRPNTLTEVEDAEARFLIGKSMDWNKGDILRKEP